MKEREVIKENDGESEYYIDKLVKVDEELQAFGVSSPSFESLRKHRICCSIASNIYLPISAPLWCFNFLALP